MKPIRKKDIATFIMRCLNEMEADGYQTWETGKGKAPNESGYYDDPVADASVSFGFENDESLWFNVGDRKFIVKVTMPRAGSKAKGGAP